MASPRTTKPKPDATPPRDPVTPGLMRLVVCMVFAVILISLMGMVLLALLGGESQSAQHAQGQLSQVLSAALGGLLLLIGGAAKAGRG